MVQGKVVGTIVSTQKVESLIGSKFMQVDLYDSNGPTGRQIIAVDSVGAGIGEQVLITTGSGARLALLNQSAPVDAVIVGIID